MYAVNDAQRKTAQAVQICLYEAFKQFLYSSFVSLSRKSWFCREENLKTSILRSLFKKLFNLGAINIQTFSLPQKDFITSFLFSERLSQAYFAWEKYLQKQTISSNTLTLPQGQSYEVWFGKGGNNHKYWPVHKLRRIFQQSEVDFFKRTIVHGSIATLDDAAGFSDMDLAFIIHNSVLKNPAKLLRLRKLAAEILCLTYAFDPFMHHGPYYLLEIDLQWYPEALFPPLLFGYGVDLIDDSLPIGITIRPSDDITDQMLEMFDKFFENWPDSPFVLKDRYDIEWILSSVMILPALYLQKKTGRFYYKRDTFQLASQDFSAKEWEPIRLATEKRATLDPRIKPSKFIVCLARTLCWPGLLQSWARHHRNSIKEAQKTMKDLGPDYIHKIRRLIRAIKDRINKG